MDRDGHTRIRCEFSQSPAPSSPRHSFVGSRILGFRWRVPGILTQTMGNTDWSDSNRTETQWNLSSA